MGFFDSIKNSLDGALGAKNGKNNDPETSMQHPQAPQPAKKGLFSGLFGGHANKPVPAPDTKPLERDTGQGQIYQEDERELIDNEIKQERHDMLEMVGVAENYPVPDNVLLVGDLDRVRFDVTSPKGYDMKMVEEFFDSVHESITWYVEKLQQRNNDIRKMEEFLNRQATDIHNFQVAQAMSDPELSVVTGVESNKEQELQEAQLLIIKLRDENNRLKEALHNSDGQVIDADTQSKYEELQNQLALSQMENKKLRSQLKRQAREDAVARDDMISDDDFMDDSLDQGMPAPTGMDDDEGGMPMPMSMPTKNKPQPKDNSSMPMPTSMESLDRHPVGAALKNSGGRGGENPAYTSLSQAATRDDDMDDFMGDEMGMFDAPDDTSPFARPSLPQSNPFTHQPTSFNDDTNIPLPVGMDEDDYDDYDVFGDDADDGVIDMDDYM